MDAIEANGSGTGRVSDTLGITTVRDVPVRQAAIFAESGLLLG